MRGDMEILGYNLIQWLCGTLPWEKDLKKAVEVQKQKEKAYENMTTFLKTCFGSKVPEPIKQYLKMTSLLKFNEAPNYVKFKDLFVQGLKQLGQKPSGVLEFKVSASKNKDEEEADDEDENEDEEEEEEEHVPVVRRKPLKKSPKVKKTETKKPKVDLNMTVCNEKSVAGNSARDKVLASIDFDSESEYDIYIKKRKKNDDEETEAVKVTLGATKRTNRTTGNGKESQAKTKVIIFKKEKV